MKVILLLLLAPLVACAALFLFGPIIEEQRLKKAVGALTPDDAIRLSGQPAGFNVFGPVRTLSAKDDIQSGIVLFKDGSHVTFAFSGHPAVAVFRGPSYARTVRSSIWCCELQAPESSNLAEFDAWLDGIAEG